MERSGTIAAVPWSGGISPGLDAMFGGHVSDPDPVVIFPDLRPSAARTPPSSTLPLGWAKIAPTRQAGQTNCPLRPKAFQHAFQRLSGTATARPGRAPNWGIKADPDLRRNPHVQRQSGQLAAVLRQNPTSTGHIGQYPRPIPPDERPAQAGHTRPDRKCRQIMAASALYASAKIAMTDPAKGDFHR